MLANVHFFFIGPEYQSLKVQVPDTVPDPHFEGNFEIYFFYLNETLTNVSVFSFVGFRLSKLS
jgi:hypothetical protein